MTGLSIRYPLTGTEPEGQEAHANVRYCTSAQPRRTVFSRPNQGGKAPEYEPAPREGCLGATWRTAIDGNEPMRS
jgi:hypothetical protein